MMYLMMMMPPCFSGLSSSNSYSYSYSYSYSCTSSCSSSSSRSAIISPPHTLHTDHTPLIVHSHNFQLQQLLLQLPASSNLPFPNFHSYSSSSSSSSTTGRPILSFSAAAAWTKMKYSISSSSSSRSESSDQEDIEENEDHVFLNQDQCSITTVANKAVDAAGEVLRKYFRNKNLHILDKDDLSPVTIADQAAEEAMVSIIMDNFPSHSIYGEEKGWIYEEKNADYVWVLDPIDGTKSFITGKPLFGTLVAVFHKEKPIVGIVDQPILRERWIGISGRKTTFNGEEVSTRACSTISDAYLYTTSPHLFSGDAETAFSRVRSKVKCPLYGCDCYAYALLASGYVDLVVESGLKPYDILALIPVIEGAGGVITDWRGGKLLWEASSSDTKGYNVVAAGDPLVHKEALELLQWN